MAQDVLLNFNPIGVTEKGTIRVLLGQTLNFRNSVIQFLCGSVTLLSHCVTGIVSVSMTYTSSGVDEKEGPEEEQEEEEPQQPAPKRTKLTWTREPRTTPGRVTGIEVSLRPGLTMAERLERVNEMLNKDYRKSGGQKFGKICNWPVTVCDTPQGYIR